MIVFHGQSKSGLVTDMPAVPCPLPAKPSLHLENIPRSSTPESSQATSGIYDLYTAERGTLRQKVPSAVLQCRRERATSLSGWAQGCEAGTTGVHRDWRFLGAPHPPRQISRCVISVQTVQHLVLANCVPVEESVFSAYYHEVLAVPGARKSNAGSVTITSN